MNSTVASRISLRAPQPHGGGEDDDTDAKSQRNPRQRRGTDNKAATVRHHLEPSSSPSSSSSSSSGNTSGGAKDRLPPVQMPEETANNPVGAFRVGGRTGTVGVWDDTNDDDDDDTTLEPDTTIVVDDGDAAAAANEADDGTDPAAIPEINAHLVDEDAERLRYEEEAQQRILGQMVTTSKAEVVDPTLQRRRVCIGGVLLFFLLLGGGLTGGLLASRNNKSSPVETEVVVVVEEIPTLAPTRSLKPSSQPSLVPSVAPTAFHDDCQKARIVDSLPFFFRGRTDLAEELGDDDNPAMACPAMLSGFDRGVWLTFTAPTGGCVTATGTGTNFDVILASYVGTSCDDLACVTSGTLSSEATWTLQKGEIYFILVAGQDSSAGDFTLTISETGSICNTVCEDPVFVNRLPFAFSGNNELAPFLEPDNTALDCFLDIISTDTAGLWFELTGTGSCITVSTVGSELDTALALYEGDCDQLVCLNANDDVNAEATSELLFFAKRDKRYRVLVGNSQAQGRGNFIVNIKETEEKCGEHGLLCDYTADDGDDQDFTCFLFEQEPPVPFNATIVTTCQTHLFAEPTNDKCLCYIFVGDLNDFNAIRYEDVCQFCSFVPQENTTDGEWEIYYDCSNVIAGSCAARSREGKCIATDEVVPVWPDTDYVTCDEAIIVAGLPYVDSGNSKDKWKTLIFDIAGITCPQVTPLRSALFHRVIGSGSCLRATTFGSEFDTHLAVVSGKCGDVECVRENDDWAGRLTSEVEWFGQEGEEYRILLSSYDDTQFGEYNFRIEEFDCTSNEACVGATLITEVPFEDSGSTVASVVVDLDSQALACPTIVEGSKGVWYVGESLIDNSCVTISTEGSQLDTVIAVYSGTCLHLECVAENDDASPLVRSSRVSWTVTSGVLYYVFVGGAQRQQGGDYTVAGTFMID